MSTSHDTRSDLRPMRLAAVLVVLMASIIGLGIGALIAQVTHIEPGLDFSLSACAAEDGPAPCVWDASAQGNGEGESFFLDRSGEVTLIDHETAADLLRNGVPCPGEIVADGVCVVAPTAESPAYKVTPDGYASPISDAEYRLLNR